MKTNSLTLKSTEKMRQSDNNFIAMCKTVQQVLTKHNPTWNSQVAFNKLAATYRGIMDSLSEATEGAELVSTGATSDKTNAELNAVAMAVDLAKRASVYALEVNNMELHDQLRVNKSTLLRRPDELTLAKLRNIIATLTTVVADLSDYGVSPTDIDNLVTATDDFDKLIPRPRTVIVARKGFNQEAIPSLLAQLRTVLYKLDSLMNIFTNGEFKREYKDARIIVDLGRRPEGAQEAPDA